MPKETFYNLDQVKRQKIMDVVIDEFAAHDYKSASVTKICGQAGIAKGSFYQYFDHKKDLYRYVMNYIGQSKMAYFAKYQSDLDMSNTFDFLRMLYAMGIEFTYKNPKLYHISKYFMNMPESERRDILGEQLEESDQYLKTMFQKGKEAGYIREELDVAFLARILTDLSNSISDYYLFELDKASIDKDTFMNIANTMIDVLENGLRKK